MDTTLDKKEVLPFLRDRFEKPQTVYGDCCGPSRETLATRMTRLEVKLNDIQTTLDQIRQELGIW